MPSTASSARASRLNHMRTSERQLLHSTGGISICFALLERTNESTNDDQMESIWKVPNWSGLYRSESFWFVSGWEWTNSVNRTLLFTPAFSRRFSTVGVNNTVRLLRPRVHQHSSDLSSSLIEVQIGDSVQMHCASAEYCLFNYRLYLLLLMSNIIANMSDVQHPTAWKNCQLVRCPDNCTACR